jgi:hypothetical protein
MRQVQADLDVLGLGFHQNIVDDPEPQRLRQRKTSPKHDGKNRFIKSNEKGSLALCDYVNEQWCQKHGDSKLKLRGQTS